MEASALSNPPSKDESLGTAIASLRDASRRLVREWGFLRSVFANSSLSPAAVHCLIEISNARTTQARRPSHLHAELRVSREELEPILSDLIASGSIAVDDEFSDASGDAAYRLTDTGAQMLRAIDEYAQDQVARALAMTSTPGAAADITAAFRLYTTALERARTTATPDSSRSTSPGTVPTAIPQALAPARTVMVAAGYRPGIVSSALQMHMDYYHGAVGWGCEFETSLGAALGDLVSRLEHPTNQAWSAVEIMPGLPPVERIVGTIFIDGQIPGKEGTARLRAFIVDDSARGLGLGRKMVKEAMAFVAERGFSECRLTTLRMLLVARRLYEEAGFKEVAETRKSVWGRDLMELEYCWTRV